MSLIATRLQGRLPDGAFQRDLTGQQNVLYASYCLLDPDANRLRGVITDGYTSAYTQAIDAELRGLGCNLSANSPKGRELAHIKTLVERDVDSIVETFNRELKNQIRRQFAGNPDWSRRQHEQALDNWQQSRLQSKNRLIATATKGNAGEYARTRFVEENRFLQDALYTWFAVPPVLANSHPECIYRVRLGRVTWAVAQEWGRTHPNCRHTRKLASLVVTDCGAIWRG